ncbi:YybH family protein [Methylocaldum sp. GT1BB]|uniref:YybH family protein n=1 Tax=Methylocaldum sp. GT1BB TaxID=3438963 RepID=UPI003DA14DCC
MTRDEQSIRELITTWHRATASGQVSEILPLMSEDVVFLVAGQAPMCGRQAFEQGFRNVLQTHRLHVEGEIREIEISENWVYCWSCLSVTVTPRNGGVPVQRTGDTLTILRKGADGAWRVFRDANLLAVAASEKTDDA